MFPSLVKKRVREPERNMLKSIGRFSLLFVIILIYFLYSNGWYEKEQLVIKGGAAVGGVLDLKLDSGAGFNRYEKKRFAFNLVAKEESQLPVTIRYIGDRNGASLSNDIVCHQIRVDRVKLDLATLVGEGNGYLKDDGVHLNEQYRELQLSVPASTSVEIELLTNNHSGKVEITVGATRVIKDLYIANIEAKSRLFQYWLLDAENKFEVFFNLPRYRLKAVELQKIRRRQGLVIESVELLSDTKHLPVDLEG